MKFLKTLILLLFVNNFAFSAEIDKKSEKGKNVNYIAGYQLTGIIEKFGKEPNVTYRSSLDNHWRAAITCRKIKRENDDSIFYFCELLEEDGISLGLNNAEDHHARLASLYNQQNSDQNKNGDSSGCIIN